MPNVASLLKAEIVRLARKEVRAQVSGLRKTIGVHRRQIAALKRDVSSLQGKAKALAKQTARKVDAADPTSRVRFTAKGMRSMRTKLGLSATQLAMLVGVSPQSIYNWEHDKSSPRQSQVAAITALRGIGRKEARRRLEASAVSEHGRRIR